MPPMLSLLVSYVQINRIMAGAIVMACLVIGLFFLRFWRRTHDRLFAIFALAFWVLAVNRLLSAAAAEDREIRELGYYAVRLLAFLLILAAVIDKNRSSRQQSPGG